MPDHEAAIVRKAVRRAGRAPCRGELRRRARTVDVERVAEPPATGCRGGQHTRERGRGGTRVALRGPFVHLEWGDGVRTALEVRHVDRSVARDTGTHHRERAAGHAGRIERAGDDAGRAVDDRHEVAAAAARHHEILGDGIPAHAPLEVARGHVGVGARGEPAARAKRRQRRECLGSGCRAPAAGERERSRCGGEQEGEPGHGGGETHGLTLGGSGGVTRSATDAVS